jgi:putative sensor protein
MEATLTTEPVWRAALRPLITARGWTAVTHHLAGLPLGIAYLTWFVTGLALGLGLAITLIGIPILTLVFATVRPLLAAERGMANALLGAGIPEAPLAPAPERAGIVARVKAYWTDGATWRGVAYLLARFPVGLATFTVALTAYATAAALLAAPILVPLDAHDAWDIGAWRIDTVLEGLALVPLGLITLVAAGWISEGMGWVSRELARWGAR